MLELLKKYNRLVLISTCLLIFAIGLFISLLGEWSEIAQPYTPFLEGIGGSLIASSLFFVLVSFFIEPAKARLQAEEVSAYAIDVANARFQERFESNLPIASFSPSSIPRADFQTAFSHLIKSSRRYEFKGGIGDFTAFRLFEQSKRKEFQQLDRIFLNYIDPRSSRAIRALSDRHEKPRENICASIDEFRNKLFISLVALFDIGHDLTTSIYFHRELPSFRCELFDGGMFLTYYLGAAEYRETIQYGANTRQYRAYKASLELSRDYSGKVVQFGRSSPSGDLISNEEKLKMLLSELGCQKGIPDLRAQREELYERFRSETSNLDPALVF